jgi:hypothetical protein
MNTKRMLAAGVVATIFEAVVGAVTCGGVFNWVYKIEPANIWKPMTDGPGTGYMIGLLILMIVLSFIYALINKGIPGKNKYVKGLVFGLIVWAVGMLPGMLATYAFMTVAPTVIVYWTVLSAIQTPLKGLIISAIYGE